MMRPKIGSWTHSLRNTALDHLLGGLLDSFKLKEVPTYLGKEVLI